MKKIPCVQCGEAFRRAGTRDKCCSLFCKVKAGTNEDPGQGPEGECWEWAWSRKPKGYGQVAHQGRMLSVHRVAYELFVGPIPAGLCVLHKCDNPPCVRPDHLFVGTVQDNNADMVEKGRQARGSDHGAKVAGERHGSAKLSAEEVRRICWLYRQGGVTQRELAEEFGVSNQLISAIILRKKWRRLP